MRSMTLPFPTSAPRDFVMPPRDMTPVKIEIKRKCWVEQADAPMREAKPGDVLSLPRWLADVLAVNGKASLL